MMKSLIALRVEATQDTFENELVVVEIIITYPNFTLVPFVERGERVDIIDDDALVVSDGVETTTIQSYLKTSKS